MADNTTNAYFQNVRAVRRKLTDAEILAQLAEEAAELAQAALKYRRCLDGTNPTPITRKEAHDVLVEELADVFVCVDALDGDYNSEASKDWKERKAERWAKRLNVDSAAEC